MGTLHFVCAVLHAPPEVAAAYHQAHLDTHVHALLDHAAHIVDNIKVQTPVGFPGQGLTADFQKNSPIFDLRQITHSFLIFPYFNIIPGN